MHARHDRLAGMQSPCAQTWASSSSAARIKCSRGVFAILFHSITPRRRHATVTGERLLGFAEPKCKNPGIPAGVSRSCAGPAPLEHCEGSSAPFLLGRSCKQARRTQRRYSPDQHGVPPSRASIPSEFRCKNDPRRAGRVRATSLCVQSWPRARPRLWSRKTARPPPTWHLCRAI